MARVDLRCTSCGYQFFISDIQLSKPEGVKCPSCLAPVGITGPAAGGAPRKAVRVLAAGPDAGSLKMKMWMGLGAGALLCVIGLAFLLFSGSGKGSDEEMRRRLGRVEVPSNPGPARGVREGAVRPSPAPGVPGSSLPAPAPGSSAALPAPAPVAAPTPAPAGTPVPAPAPPAAVVATELPADLVKALREEVLALAVWHLNLALTPAEKGRVEALLKEGKGEAADLEFLRGVAGGPRVRAVREDALQIREGFEKLEKDAMESLPVDKVLMNDGRTLFGKILEDTGDVVKLERKFSGGVGGLMPLPRNTIKEVQKGKGPGGEFKTRWAAARKAGPTELSSLMGWCKENSLPLQASLAAHAVLAADPGRAEARQEAGFAADPVARMLDAEKQGGFISHQGRRWVPSELKEKLVRDGYTLLNGQWYARKERMISIPGLFRYERQEAKPVLISGSGIGQAHDIEYVYSPVQEVASNSFVEKAEMKYLRRFWAPPQETRLETHWPPNKGGIPPATSGFNQRLQWDKPVVQPGDALKGEVYLTVPLNAPLIEASVMTAAEVKGAASITVSLIIDGRRERLYACAPKEDKSHKLPDLIRGRTQVDLVAEFGCSAVYKEKVEKRKVSGPRKNDSGAIIQSGIEVAHYRMIPDYQAVLFPSNSNTLEVFRLTAATAEAAPGIDKLFENARELLK